MSCMFTRLYGGGRTELVSSDTLAVVSLESSWSLALLTKAQPKQMNKKNHAALQCCGTHSDKHCLFLSQSYATAVLDLTHRRPLFFLFHFHATENCNNQDPFSGCTSPSHFLFSLKKSGCLKPVQGLVSQKGRIFARIDDARVAPCAELQRCRISACYVLSTQFLFVIKNGPL